MAQLAYFMPSKHEDISLDTQHPHTELDMVAYKDEDRRTLGLFGQLSVSW